MNNKYFVKEKLKSILNTWQKAIYVETPQDLVEMFKASEVIEAFFMLEGDYTPDQFYDLCNLVIDEAVESGVMTA